MQKLSRENLVTLERYAVERTAFRAKVIAHKKPRRVAIDEERAAAIGAHAR